MSASHQPITSEIAQKIVSEMDLEKTAREAAELIMEQQNLMRRIAEFSRRAGGQPHDVVLSFGMKKLESKIITK